MEIKIYTLSSTRDLNNIRYVGKTKQSLKRRLSQHLSNSKDPKHNYIYNYKWINKEIKEGYEIIITELDSLNFEENESWEWLEQYWISQIKSWGFRLTNLTSGGDGNKNQVFSKESIEKRASKIRGIPRDQETKNKISKGLTGFIRSDIQKEKIRNSIIELQGKKIQQFDIFGNFIKEWNCSTDVTRFYNFKNASNINKAACSTESGKSTIAYGFYWKYSNYSGDIKIDKSKYVCQFDLNGNFIKEWFNLNTISKELGLSLSSLLRCCKHTAKKVGNYFFCYYPEFESGEYVKYLPDKATINYNRKVVQKDLNGNIIKIYNSASQAAIILKFGRNEILDCCRNERESFKNFKFEYV